MLLKSRTISDDLQDTPEISIVNYLLVIQSLFSSGLTWMLCMQ